MALGEERPQIGRLQVLQSVRTDLLASVSAEKVDQPVRRRDIRADRMRGAAPVVLEIASPASGKLASGVMR